MRISTQTFYATSTARLTEIQANLMKTQQQIQSGSKIMTPSDDPVAAAKVLGLAQSQSQNAQYAANRQNAKDPLQQSEGVLTSVSELIQDVKDAALAASNGTASDADKKVFADTISSRLDQLLALANTTDTSGNPIYSGYRTGGPAFSKTATGIIYNGDQGQRLIQADSARQLSTNDSGDSIFQAGGNDLFKTMGDLVATLNQPNVTAADKAAQTASINAATKQLNGSLDNVLNVRASIGTRLKEIDSLDTTGSSRDLYLQQSIADLQGVDLIKAVTDLSQQKTMLDASQQSFAKVASMSLFDYMR